jgi:endonuclease YncB( thermonuclease family)
MKINTCILVFLFIFSLSATVFAQRHIAGKVTEIIDERTFVVEASPTQKYTSQLQYIETPDTNQPLSSVVKDHIAKLLLNKNVQIEFRQMSGGVMSGKV